MALTFVKLFEPVKLTAALATYYTVQATPTTNLLRSGRVRLTNLTASAAAVDIHAVPSAGAAGDSNAVAKNLAIPASSYLDVDLPVMKSGDFLQMKADAVDKVTAHGMDGVVFS